MNIMITGSFGSLGTHVLDFLINSNHKIRCFSTKSRKSRMMAKKYHQNVEIIYGDIRNYEEVKKAVSGQDLILHFAAIVPPRFNYEPLDYSTQVNVTGTKNILNAMKEQKTPPKIFYPSSVAVFGDVRDRGACIITSDEPTNPNDDDIYAQQKVLSEEAIQNSGFQWSIFRFGFMPNTKELKFDPLMFEVPLDTNMEVIHPQDAALAIVNALDKKEIWNKIFHIAGGEKCRLTYKEFVGEMLKAMGIGSLPDNAFGSNDFHCAFFDTSESQNLLNYQKHTFNDIIKEMKENNKILSFFARMFRLIVKTYLLKKSPYYKKKRK
ncbi:MAG: NAD(P)-dependent oxidoreductase [Candidatus Heimdallarchaeota archaeon]|nr:NAD(P)-dependent oxidoreductase [Candidatus Heimdallarchaeota archaeon]